jgi:hypothetical protein
LTRGIAHEKAIRRIGRALEKIESGGDSFGACVGQVISAIDTNGRWIIHGRAERNRHWRNLTGIVGIPIGGQEVSMCP